MAFIDFWEGWQSIHGDRALPMFQRTAEGVAETVFDRELDAYDPQTDPHYWQMYERLEQTGDPAIADAMYDEFGEYMDYEDRADFVTAHTQPMEGTPQALEQRAHEAEVSMIEADEEMHEDFQELDLEERELTLEMIGEELAHKWGDEDWEGIKEYERQKYSTFLENADEIAESIVTQQLAEGELAELDVDQSEIARDIAQLELDLVQDTYDAEKQLIRAEADRAVQSATGQEIQNMLQLTDYALQTGSTHDLMYEYDMDLDAIEDRIATSEELEEHEKQLLQADLNITRSQLESQRMQNAMQGIEVAQITGIVPDVVTDYFGEDIDAEDLMMPEMEGFTEQLGMEGEEANTMMLQMMDEFGLHRVQGEIGGLPIMSATGGNLVALDPNHPTMVRELTAEEQAIAAQRGMTEEPMVDAGFILAQDPSFRESQPALIESLAGHEMPLSEISEFIDAYDVDYSHADRVMEQEFDVGISTEEYAEQFGVDPFLGVGGEDQYDALLRNELLEGAQEFTGEEPQPGAYAPEPDFTGDLFQAPPGLFETSEPGEETEDRGPREAADYEGDAESGGLLQNLRDLLGF